MNQASAPAAVDVEEENLNRAISELRGVLRDEGSPAGAFAATGEDGFGAAAGGAPAGIIMNIPVDVQIVLGSTEMQVSELMSLRKGATVALNRKIGEPVDVIVNGRRIARGEITVLESDPSRFGIRLTEIISTSKTS